MQQIMTFTTIGADALAWLNSGGIFHSGVCCGDRRITLIKTVDDDTPVEHSALTTGSPTAAEDWLNEGGVFLGAFGQDGHITVVKRAEGVVPDKPKPRAKRKASKKKASRRAAAVATDEGGAQ
ncbi:MAG: hypothetical protein K0V04_16135 [Deltaproteobacteria bacterium]|nr:hypothetical protein [Deltaproteobacteria bacterium]